MKKTGNKLILLLLLAVIGLAAYGCTAPSNDNDNDGKTDEPFVEKVYLCEYNSTDTINSNGLEKGVVQNVFNKTHTFAQTNTLTLKESNRYELKKLLSAEAKEKTNNEQGAKISYTFTGLYEKNGDKLTLKAPESATGDVNWANMAYVDASLNGKYNSTDNPGILWYFTTGFLGQNCRYDDMTVNISDETQKFTFDKDGLYVDAGDGNEEKWYLENTDRIENRPLEGKTIYWLGSSVTVGATNKRVSMSDYIEKRQDAVCVKEAVSGTTLFGDPTKEKSKSYLARLVNGTNFNVETKIDALVCQISTNDVSSVASRSQLGKATAADKKALSDFDTDTTIGAVEYILSYVKETWDCPVIFYAGTMFGSEHGYYYSQLVKEVKNLQNKWDFTVLDMFNDAEFNDISKEDYAYYMIDPIHPTMAGYHEWWVPEFEKALIEVI